MKPFSSIATLMIVVWFLIVNVLFFWQRLYHSSILGGFFGK